MSKKIVFNEQLKNEIIKFITDTYQCTISDVCNNFNISRNSITNNFDKDFLDTILFHGVKDSTKQKLRDCNLGKKQSDEAKRKKSLSCKKTAALRSNEKKKEIAAKGKATKIDRWGSWEEYSKFQVEKSKQTKLERYGDENYNNMGKNMSTKMERYGNPYYNNQEQITKTQFLLYGGYAFQDSKKVKSTMLKKYGVEHNWSSDNPKLNGRDTMFKNAGSKEQHYINIIKKGRKTKLDLYGDEFYSNHEQAKKTCLEKYGVPYYCVVDSCQSLAHSKGANQKRTDTKNKNHSWSFSQPEVDVKKILENYFGKDDVYSQYNQDKRYPFFVDFYIKSLDLFIELNLHPTHGRHPFNKNDDNDLNTLEILKNNPTPWNKSVIDVWSVRDVNKLNTALKNNINYLMIYPEDNWLDIISIIKEKIYK